MNLKYLDMRYSNKERAEVRCAWRNRRHRKDGWGIRKGGRGQARKESSDVSLSSLGGKEGFAFPREHGEEEKRCRG